MTGDIGKTIKSIRQQTGLRASDVAEAVGLSRPYYTQLEGGTRRLSADHVRRIAQVLAVPVADLFEVEGGERKPKTGRRKKMKHLKPLNTTELRKRLKELGRHGRVLALLDACRSGAATLVEGALPVAGGALRSALAGLPNVTVLTSSSSATPSFEREDWQNGAFTEVLLRALGKDADDDQNGLISMTELTEYLSEQLPRLTQGEQTQQPGMEVRFQSELFVSDL